MNLFDIYNKLQQVRDFLSGPGADAVEGVAEVSQKIADSARDIAAYLRTLDSKVGVTAEEAEAMEGLRRVRCDCDKIAGGSGNTEDGRMRALPPGLTEILAALVVKLIDRLLDRWKNREQPATV